MNEQEQFEVRDLRGGDWFWAPNSLLSDQNLKMTDKVVYMALAAHANQFQISWPSVKKIAELSGSSERAVQYSFTRLELSGWIKVIRVANKSSKYILLRPNSSRGANFAPGANSDKSLTGVGVHHVHPNNIEQNNYIYSETENSGKVEKIVDKTIIEKTRKELVSKGILRR